jgi:hypothetical protein
MVNMENYEEYMLLYADGELNAAEEKALLAFVEEYPQLKEELKLYAAAKVMPDTTQVFEGKEQLMKEAPAKRTIALDKRWLYTAAAACVAMMVFFIFKNNNNETTNEPVIVNNTPVTKPTDQQSVQPADTEEFHSTPVDPISVKQAPKQQPAMVAENKSKKQVNNKQQDQPLVAQQPSPVVVTNQKPQQVISPVTIAPKQQEPVIAHEEEKQTIEPIRKEKSESFLAMAAEDRLQGANAIAEAFGEKIEKVKNIKRKIQDTDVSVKIGKREILIVRL